MYTREQLIQYSYFNHTLDGRRIADVIDPLTGLISKNHMIGFAKSLIEENIPFTFGMIDLDNFKYINDTYGHSTGDEVLTTIARKLEIYLDGYGLAGRFGGDEYLFINFRDLEYDDKKNFSINMYGDHGVLRRSYKLQNYTLFVTGTTGMATYPNNAKDYNELFTMMDKTLYRGKSKGRNCYIIYVKEKHKDIEIIKLKNNTLYETLKNLASSFDSKTDIYEKMRAGYESLINDLHITDMFFIGKSKQIISIKDHRSIGLAKDIDSLMEKEIYSTNNLVDIESKSPYFYQVLKNDAIEAILITKITIGEKDYGYLICAEPHTLRIWQESEHAILFMFARMVGDFLSGKQIELD